MILAAVGAAVKADAVSKVSEGIAGVFGDTATDRARVSTANSLLAQALQGSDDALGQLIYQAYEPRRGMPGDTRRPIDNKYSPQDTRDLAVKALRQYVQGKGGLPTKYQAYAARLNADVIPPKATVTDQITEVIQDGIRQGVAQGTVTTAQNYTATARPWLIGAAVVVGAWLVYRALSK